MLVNQIPLTPILFMNSQNENELSEVKKRILAREKVQQEMDDLRAKNKRTSRTRKKLERMYIKTLKHTLII